MKKIVIIIASMSLIQGTVLNAQDTGHTLKRVEIGGRFMPTVSAFKMSTSSGGTAQEQATFGYGISGMLAFNFSKHIGIQGEIIYNSLSQKYKDQGLQREINVRYVNIPFLLSLNTGKSNAVNLNVVAGPQFGISAGSGFNASGAGSTDTLQAVFAVKKNDFGFAYGAGLEFTLNSARTVRLDVGYRGVYGFTNISNTSQTNDSNSYYMLSQAKVKTHSVYAGLTFLF